MNRAASVRSVLITNRTGTAAAAAYRHRQSPAGGTAAGAAYRQGQSPAPRRREYFYWVDTHGRLYLDDAKVKNFITCFKDERFLAFFFRQLQPNRSGRYEDSFPFVSPCGPEHNFVRCQDVPIVFTRVLEGERKGEAALLSYCGGGERLVVPFRPQCLTFCPENGRLYHPGPEGGGGVGLVRSALVEEWGDGFEYGEGGAVPTHFVWGGRRYELGHPLLGRLRERGGGASAPNPQDRDGGDP